MALNNNKSINLKRDINILSIYFRYFVIISAWKKAWPFIWANLNLLCPMMLCSKMAEIPSDQFWRRWKCEKLTDGQMDGQPKTGDQKSSGELTSNAFNDCWCVKKRTSSSIPLLHQPPLFGGGGGFTFSKVLEVSDLLNSHHGIGYFLQGLFYTRFKT